MHEAARQYVGAATNVFNLHGDVLEIGGINVNGGVRDLIPHTRWVSVDIIPGPDVDIVADAADLRLGELFDVVVSTEVFEHTARSPEIIVTAFEHLKPAGYFVATMAGPGRPVHSANGGQLQPDEFYENVEPNVLAGWLAAAGFSEMGIDQAADDVRCYARKGER
jgi:SAM-dependent methyltransferase